MAGFGSVFAVAFGILWTVLAFSITAAAPFPIGVIFPLFGLIFIGAGLASAFYNFGNATKPNLFSSFDVVDGVEEPDPLNQHFGSQTRRANSSRSSPGRDIEGTFCPYCRADLEPDFEFCPKCGSDL